MTGDLCTTHVKRIPGMQRGIFDGSPCDFSAGGIPETRFVYLTEKWHVVSGKILACGYANLIYTTKLKPD